MDTVTTPADLDNATALATPRTYFKLKSFFTLNDKPLPVGAFQAMRTWMGKANAQGGYVQMDMWGNASKAFQVSNDATAFPYRNALYSVQYGIEWENEADTQTNLALIDQLEKALQPFIGSAVSTS